MEIVKQENRPPASIVKKLDCLCYTLSLRGMGSPGDINNLTRADFLEDCLAAYDFIASEDGVDGTRITVAGESLGGYLACVLVSRRDVANLILRVPSDFPDAGFSDIPQIRTAGHFSRTWKEQRHDPGESRALDALPKYGGSICLVAAEKDQVVPYQTTENYLNAIVSTDRLEYHMMKNAGHALMNPAHFQQFQKITEGFLAGN